jgi:hypothetical protein
MDLTLRQGRPWEDLIPDQDDHGWVLRGCNFRVKGGSNSISGTKMGGSIVSDQGRSWVHLTPDQGRAWLDLTPDQGRAWLDLTPDQGR